MMCDRRSDWISRNILPDVGPRFGHFTFDVKFSDNFDLNSDNWLKLIENLGIEAET